MSNHLVLANEDPLEDCLVELAPRLVRRVEVELTRVLEQRDPALQDSDALGEVVDDSGQLTLHVPHLLVDLAQPDSDAVARQGAVSGEVDEVVGLHLQRLELRFQLRPVELLGAGLILDAAGEQPSGHLDELRHEFHSPVVLGDQLFEHGQRDESRLAGPLLLAPAEVVEVLTAVFAHGPLDDHAARSDTTVAEAVTAPERALEVVVVDAAPLTRDAAKVQHLLDAVEQRLGHDRGVAALVDLALINDAADVVLVSKKQREF